MTSLADIRARYDVTDHQEAEIVIPQLPGDGIVLIVGTSGSGKSTILRSLGESPVITVDNTRSTIENFTSPERGEELLTAAGLRSVPAWFRPPNTLSNGEYHRFEIALGLDRGVTQIDEFTSVVDRDTAASLALSVRRYRDQCGDTGPLYIASCHRDIIAWLDPEWVYDTDLQVLDNRRSPFRMGSRPETVLTIRSANTNYWRYFSRYHYLDSAISRSAHCYVGFIGDKPVAFSAVLHSTNRDIHSYWRGHRTVILPEFQGRGIGTRFSDAIAQIYHDRGLRYFSKTAHPAFGEHRERSALWRPTSTNRQARNSYLKSDGTVREMQGYGGKGTAARDANRVCYSHEFTGEINKDISITNINKE